MYLLSKLCSFGCPIKMKTTLFNGEYLRMNELGSNPISTYLGASLIELSLQPNPTQSATVRSSGVGAASAVSRAGMEAAGDLLEVRENLSPYS